MRILVGIAIIILIVFLYTLYRPASSPTVTKSGPYLLTGTTAVISASDNARAFLSDSDEAIQLFVYLDGNIRIGQSVDSGSSGSSGMYGICNCASSSDCTACTQSGFKHLLNIQNVFNIQILKTPDASRQNSVSTQLSVKTQDNTNYSIETFPLPPLPEQKWTMITLSKQGRQLFVYYNSTLVLSKKTVHNFCTSLPPNCAPVSVGDNTLSGNAAMITYFSAHQGISDVTSRYQQMTDTRGNLISMQIVPTASSYTITHFTQNNFVSALCLDGSCFSSGVPEKIPVIPPIYNSPETFYA